MQDCKTLEGVVKNLRAKTSTSERAIVVIDAGIATDENLDMLTRNGFDYVCVSRSKIKNYTIDEGTVPITVEDNKKQKIKLQKIVSEKSLWLRSGNLTTNQIAYLLRKSLQRITDFCSPTRIEGQSMS